MERGSERIGKTKVVKKWVRRARRRRLAGALGMRHDGQCFWCRRGMGVSRGGVVVAENTGYTVVTRIYVIRS